MTSVSAELGQEIADVLKLAHAGDRIADAPRLEIGDRQRQQMAEQPRPELDVDAVGRVGEQIGAQRCRGWSRRAAIATRPMTSTSSVLMLRCTSTLSMTTWKNSGETSAKSWRKNEATSTSLSKPAVFVDRAQKPGDVEPAREIGERCAARHQDEPAVPDGFELGPRHQRRVAGESGAWTRILSSPALPSSRKPPSRKDGDSRQWRTGEPLPVGLSRSGP